MAIILEPKSNSIPIPESSDRNFGFVFACVFTILAFWPLLRSQPPRWWMLGFAVVFGVIAIVKPQLLHHLNRAWQALGRILHRIMSPIVLAVIFFLFVTPTAWIMRKRGNDLLSLKRRADLKSYWVNREPSLHDSESMRNQY